MEHKKSITDNELLELALKAKGHSFAKFSKFHVGAALLASNGKVYTGCNIENHSLSLSVCAERVAVYKAISEGERNFLKIAVRSDLDAFCPPCGSCRQLLFEFAPKIQVLMKDKNEIKALSIRELLPYPFEVDL